MPWNKVIFGLDDSSVNSDIGLLRAISLTNQPITNDADGQVVQFEVTKEERHISVNSGVVDFSFSGIYSIFVKLHLDVTSGFSNAIESWVESSVDGLDWIPVADTGEIKEFDAINEGTIIYKVTSSISAGTKLRLKIRATGGSPQLLSPTLSNGIKAASTAISIGSL